MPVDPGALFAERAAFVPGSTIAWGVYDGGEVLVGSTDPVRDPGAYQIGSVTKVFTGSLLALLVQRGTVALETRIGDVVERGFAPGVADVTLLELATHTAGFPRLPASMRAANKADPYAGVDDEALLAFLAELQTGAIVDGRGTFDYSNFGISVLGLLLAAAAGTRYGELLESELLMPLGMRATALAGPERNAALPAGMNADGEPSPPWTFDAFAPCGGLVSTAGDLIGFARVLCEGTSALANALREAALPHRSLRRGGAVGLCWMCEGTLRWHNGQTYGHHAMLALDLAERRAAVALWDAASPLDDICFHVVRPSRGLVPPPVERALPLETLAAYVGSYDKDSGGPLEVVADARSLIVDDGAGLQCRLYALDGRRFFAKRVPDHTFAFDVDRHGTVRGLVMEHAASGTVVMRAGRR